MCMKLYFIGIIAITILLSILIFKIFDYLKHKRELDHKKEMEKLRLDVKREKEQALFDKNNIKEEIKKEFEEEVKKEITDKIDEKIDDSIKKKIKSLEKQVKIIANTTKKA